MAKVAVIGAGFIGARIASHLALRGHRVRLAAHTEVDVARDDSVRDFFARLGDVDIVVNAVGAYGAIGRVRDVAPAAWRTAIEVNLLGAYAVCHYAIGALPAGGHLINLAGGGKGPMEERSGYAAAKSGLWRLTETLAAEEPGLHVNAIAPGPMWSGMQQALVEAGGARFVRGLKDGLTAVPVQNTLEVVDHVLATNPSGQLFFARDFKVPEPAVA